mmetsp:Transcript_17820/g.34482  ORF Transcript_17820/g.34482 Transcript_17820/m.34482 type:complete len:239 (+) Transcript_17820:5103-5819(+)
MAYLSSLFTTLRLHSARTASSLPPNTPISISPTRPLMHPAAMPATAPLSVARVRSARAASTTPTPSLATTESASICTTAGAAPVPRISTNGFSAPASMNATCVFMLSHCSASLARRLVSSAPLCSSCSSMRNTAVAWPSLTHCRYTSCGLCTRPSTAPPASGASVSGARRKANRSYMSCSSSAATCCAPAESVCVLDTASTFSMLSCVGASGFNSPPAAGSTVGALPTGAPPSEGAML